MNRRIVGMISFLIAGVFALTGCAPPVAPPPPAADRWVASSPAPSATPTPTQTHHDARMEQLPGLAKTNTIQGAVELAAIFIEQHPLLFQEAGSELFAYLSMDECEYCASEQERAQQMVAERGYQVGGEFRAWNDAKFKFDMEQLGEPLLIVEFDVYEAPYTFVNAAGEVTHSGGDKDFVAGVALLLRDDQRWVREFDTRPKEYTPWDEIPPEIQRILEQG